MHNFSIQFISHSPKVIDKISSLMGEITINDFSEQFVAPLDWWDEQKYQQQWKEGLERIKHSNYSCLVTVIQDTNKRAYLDFWVLYKKESRIYIHNYMMFDKSLWLKLQKKPFTLITCYDYIPLYRKTGSEWIIEVGNEY